MTRIAIAAAALVAATVATPALAGSKTGQNLGACAEAIRAELPLAADAVTVDFKRVKGTARSQTLMLKVSAEDVTDRVTCKVKRDQAPVISWGDELEALRVELAKRDTAPAKATTPAAS